MPRLLTSVLAATALLWQTETYALNLPDLGDESAAVISPAQERKLGEEFMRKARHTLNFLDDPELQDYIQTLGRKLAAHSDNPETDFRFYVIADPVINAFAVPGGFVGVNTGLILATQSEAELASVLAHEIAHVTQRHIPRMISQAQRMSLPAMAAVLAGILLAGSGHQGGEAAIVLTQAGLAQQSIDFTRSFEQEADRIGMTILASSGFEPAAMPAFFERMQSLNRINETSLPDFLRTHPVTSDRIAESRARADQLPHSQKPDSPEFWQARAKIRAITANDPKQVAQAFKDNLVQGKFRSENAQRYGYAWALIRANEIDAARVQAQKLLRADPECVWYRILQAETEMAGGKFKQALAVYRAAYADNATHGALVRYYANALLRTGHAQQATELLKPALRREQDDPALYKLMAEATGDTGAKVQAHQAMAEYYYLTGNPHAAIEQLRLASRFAGDNYYLQASLEARIQEIKDQIALYQSK